MSAWKGTQIKTDVLVVGGTPSGVAAALAAARRGVKVLLVEPRSALGGDIVYAMLNMFDVPMRLNGSSPAANGIFGEFYRPLGIGFDVTSARALFESKVAAEPNITVWKRARVAQVWRKGTIVTGAMVETAPGAPNRAMPAPQVAVQAKVVIDATNDADVAARAGAKYYLGRQAGGFDSKQQSVSLLFSVSGANWNRMKAYVTSVQTMPAANRIGQEYASDVAPTTSKEVAAVTTNNTPHKPIQHRMGGVDGNYIWERGDVVKKYVPLHPNVMALSVNFGKQSDGTVILNTLNAVGVNGLNPQDKVRARRELLAEIPPFIAYLRGAMPGLSKIKLVKVAPELYVRETRHVRGFYDLKLSDIRTGRKFADRIALASYPLDLHPYIVGQINPFGPKRYNYSIPIRALVPRWIDGLLVASRSISSSYEAAGSARVIPITMAEGEACGAAAVLAVKNGWRPHQIARFAPEYRAIQDELRAGGADIGDQLTYKP
jgi:ribulose 1,5-bisphosphate synthetase/thiazole synthase